MAFDKNDPDFLQFCEERNEIVVKCLEWNISIARKMRNIMEQQDEPQAKDWVKILTYNIDQTVMVLQTMLMEHHEPAEEVSGEIAQVLPNEDYEQVEALEKLFRYSE